VVSNVNDAVRHLGTAVAAIHLAVGVEEFILMGGLALGLGDSFRQTIAGFASVACWDLGQDWGRMIELGLPDDDGGMIGAGLIGLGLVDFDPW
jgi:glucokinase